MRQVAPPGNVRSTVAKWVVWRFGPAFHAGLLYARNYHTRMEQFRTDLLSGVPPANPNI
jgi:hypothetical protein